MQETHSSIIISIVTASIFVLLLVAAVFVLFRIYFKKKNKLLVEKENLRLLYEQTIFRSRLEMQEQAFSQISQEIHDNIGQVLSLVRLQLNTLGLEEERIAPTDELLGRAISDLRHLSHNLNTTRILEGGFTRAVLQLLEHLDKTRQFKTSLKGSDVDIPLDEEKTIILFRIFQEVINNIIHHAKARLIDVLIARTINGVAIQIMDDGMGFNSSGPEKNHGLGISNMQQRALLIGAKLSIESVQGKGTTVIINVQTPLHAE
jgi:signal transduction histidine kinase